MPADSFASTSSSARLGLAGARAGYRRRLIRVIALAGEPFSVRAPTLDSERLGVWAPVVELVRDILCLGLCTDLRRGEGGQGDMLDAV